MTPLPGSSRVFLCGFRVSDCCGATVTRHCTSGRPDRYECSACGLMASRVGIEPAMPTAGVFSVFDDRGNLIDAFDSEPMARACLEEAARSMPGAFMTGPTTSR